MKPTETVLIEGVAYTIPLVAACEMLRLSIELLTAKIEAQWQPIETAPKDGTEIVVGYGRQSNFPKKIVFFNKLHSFWSNYGEADIGLPNNATHWMPLPKMPVMQPKEQP